MIRKDWLILVLLTVSLYSAYAQQVQPATSGGKAPVVPAFIDLSGSVTDLNGKPLNHVAGITFSLYKDEQSVAPLWVETQSITPDQNGHYSVSLGSTKSGGLPAEIFVAGEARWLGVQVEGQPEKPRIMLLSVPYALKAGDAQTISGLPASAFVRAVPPDRGSSTSSGENSAAGSVSALPPSTAVTTSGGTVNSVPLFSTATDIENSAITQTGTGATAKIGVNTTTPAAALDVKGTETVRGTLTLPSTAVATATAGKNSQAEKLVASSFNSATSTAVNQTFQWQAEPTGNNTASPSGTLNLLYGPGATAPTETGLRIDSKGLFTFASGQTFPGTGSVGSVALTAPASDFLVSGSPITGAGTLNLQWSVPPNSANIANAIVKRDLQGNFAASTITASFFTGGNATFAGTVNAFDLLLNGNMESGPALNTLVTGNGSSGILNITPAVDRSGDATANLLSGFSGNTIISAVGATIAGGGSNGPNCTNCTNIVNGDYGTVGGGWGNTSGHDDTIAGGIENHATGTTGVVGGGAVNTSSATSSTVSGGYQNTASGSFSTVPGGHGNIASGPNSFAAGEFANASDDHSFVWCATPGSACGSLGANSFTLSMLGPFNFFVGPNGNGCHFNPGDSAWTCASDRNIKENFTDVDPRDILQHLVRMPIQQWNMRGVPASLKHIGPFAQDFHAAFGLGGDDDRHISQGDEQGIALVAIQGLYRIVQEKDEKMASLERRLATLEKLTANAPCAVDVRTSERSLP